MLHRLAVRVKLYVRDGREPRVLEAEGQRVRCREGRKVHRLHGLVVAQIGGQSQSGLIDSVAPPQEIPGGAVGDGKKVSDDKKLDSERERSIYSDAE